MKVTWVNTDPKIASARFRSLIPKAILEQRGLIEPGTDIIVNAKHWFDPLSLRKQTPFMVMDVCDDHFESKLGPIYRKACQLADVITCNSEAMRGIIQWQTGRSAKVIDDPYEDEELEPSEGEGVLWFGHSSNKKDLTALGDIGAVKVIDSDNWTPELLDAELRKCRVALIPTGKSWAKSANRAIKAIRYGKFPVCGPLPAHGELGLGNEPIKEMLHFALHNDMTERVRALQERIRVRFSPETVTDDWWKIFQCSLIRP